MAAEKRKATKPQPRRVPSDDCEVAIRGESFYPHVGESLWVVGNEKIGQRKSRWAFLRISADLDEVKADPRAEGESDEAYQGRLTDANRAAVNILDQHYDDLMEWFAHRIVKWDWTDDQGRPFPDLDGTVKPFMGLDEQEIFYINDVLNGEGPAEALKEESTSPAT